MKIGTKIATGVVVGGLLGLFLYIYRQSVLLSSVCYDFITMTYEGVQNGIVTIGTTLKFTNYADYPITIKGYKIDVLVAYMELKMDTIVSPLSIKNTILFDYLSDQKNIIHLKLSSKRKSFLAVSSKSIF